MSAFRCRAQRVLKLTTQPDSDSSETEWHNNCFVYIYIFCVCTIRYMA